MPRAHIVMYSSIRVCFLYLFYNPYVSLFSKNFFTYLRLSLIIPMYLKLHMKYLGVGYLHTDTLSKTIVTHHTHVSQVAHEVSRSRVSAHRYIINPGIPFLYHIQYLCFCKVYCQPPFPWNRYKAHGYTSLVPLHNIYH